MASLGPLEGKLVVLLGGSGFVGNHVAQALLERGARLRIASRNPQRAYNLRPLANLGQIQFTRCNVASRKSVEAAMQGADAAVYLVGAFSGDLATLQAEGAGWAAERRRQASKSPTGSATASARASSRRNSGWSRSTSSARPAEAVSRSAKHSSGLRPKV